MENGEIICPRRRRHTGDLQELVTKGSCSVIFIVLTLVALRPIMVRQILSRADAYSAFGLVAESKRQCNKAILLDADNSQAWCQLARIHKTQGNREMAYGAYQKATQADATNKPAHFELGLMYARDDMHRQAIPYFEQVRRLGVDPPEHLQQGGFPYHKASLDMLALCCEKVGDIAKAEFILEEILVFYPGYAKADRRLAELKEHHKE